MLFNYAKKQEYYVDIKTLITEFNRFDEQVPFLCGFFSNWVKWFERCNNFDCSIPQNIRNGFYYTHIVSFGEAEIALNFNTSNLSEYADSDRLIIRNSSMRQFLQLIKPSVYQHPMDNGYTDLPIPLLCIPYPIDNENELLLIDGNHRLSRLISRHSDNVSYKIIDDLSIIIREIPSNLERAIYLYYLSLSNARHLGFPHEQTELLKRLISDSFPPELRLDLITCQLLSRPNISIAGFSL